MKMKDLAMRYSKVVETFFILCMHAKSLSCVQLFCGPINCSLPGSYVHGILQARILEWVAMPSSRGSSQHRD